MNKICGLAALAVLASTLIVPDVSRAHDGTKYFACKSTSGAPYILITTVTNITQDRDQTHCTTGQTKVSWIVPAQCATAANPRFFYCDAGTVNDGVTGLQWELKDTNCGSNDLHCVNTLYTWTDPNDFVSPWPPNGSLFTQFLAGLNATVTSSADGDTVDPTSCFAHHCDWRIPNIAELSTIVLLTANGCGNATSGSSCIDPAFNPSGYASSGFFYWSSSSYAPYGVYAGEAWLIYFVVGRLNVEPQFDGNCGRAVRGGGWPSSSALPSP